jgi:transcriptional regulator with XRE-family HTH domain
MIGARRVFRDLDLLKAMRDQRLAIGMTMEDVNHRAGICDRYYNKVEIGLQSDLRRQLRAQMLGRVAKYGSSVRRPFRMCTRSAWALERAGLAMVVVPAEKAGSYRTVDPAVADELLSKVEGMRGSGIRPLQVSYSIVWILGALGLSLVVMDVEEALWTVEPDPVTELERRRMAA